ncbi:MAG: hydantoinase B/oxoprolinase family protein [Thermoleophilia bacterium]
MSAPELDGARLAVLAARVEGIATMMGNTIESAPAAPGVLNRARDFSCCILTGSCELLVMAESLPVHVMGADLLVRSIPQLQGRACAPATRSCTTRPYHGNSHAADHVIVVPVFDEAERIRYWMYCKAHQADINAPSRRRTKDRARRHEEGAIFPGVRIQRDRQDIRGTSCACAGSGSAARAVVRRLPRDAPGRPAASARSPRSRGRSAGTRSKAFDEAWLSYSERRMRAVIAGLPESETTGVSIHDPIPGTPPEGIRIQSTVRVRPGEQRIEVDLRDNPDNLPCGLNMTESTSRAAALIGVFDSLDPSIPKNGGSARCVDVLLREGCVAGIPRHPASCSVATTNVSDRIINATVQAFAQVAHGVGMAEFGSMFGANLAVASGFDSRLGRAHINQVFFGATAGAASPYTDGWLTYLHPGNGGLCHVDSVEVAEHYQPLVVWDRHLLPDSEGAGWRRGASSLEVSYGPVDDDLTVAFVCDGQVNVPKGVRGGGNGRAAGNLLERTDGAREELPAVSVVTLAPGERVIAITQPGGGYGPPAEREPERVAEDVREGWITAERGREVYRVALAATGEVDAAATAALRR